MLPREFNENIASIAAGRQLEYYKSHCEGNSIRKIAKIMNVDQSSVGKSLHTLEKKAAAKDLVPNHTLKNGTALGYKLKGTSTFYDLETGEATRRWVKTCEDAEQAETRMMALIDCLRDQVPVRDYEIQAPDYVDDDLMSVYPMGDPHLGMYAWAEESGDNFDCDSCELQITRAIDRLVDTQPNSCIGRIHNLGDFFHADNENGMTEHGGNILDMDGRWGRVIRIGVRMMTHCIDRCLEKHARVEVINVPGNHDKRTAYFLSIILAEHFRDESRVFVDTTYSTSFYKEFGLVLIGCNHGEAKPQALLEIMVCDQAEAWGRTKFRYWQVGHIHHTQVKELGGVTVEAFRSLKAKDSYEARKGYRAGRDMKAILYHKMFGEIERHTCCIDMVWESR